MDELSQMQDSHRYDAIALRLAVAAYANTEAQKARAKLEQEEQKLIMERNELKNELESQEERKKQLEEDSKELKVPTDDDAFRTGDYFHRLNAFEVSEAQCKGELQGRKNAIKKLEEEIKAQENRNSKLQQKLDSMLKQLPDGTLLDGDEYEGSTRSAALSRKNQSQRGDISTYRKELAQVEKQLQTASKDCEQLRDAVREKSARLQSLPSDTLDRLLQQRREIDQELNFKKEQLRKIQIDEQQTNHELETDAKKDKKLTDELENDDPWEGERSNILNMISQARKELRTINSEIRSEDNRSKKSSLSETRSMAAKRAAMSTSGSVTSGTGAIPDNMSSVSQAINRNDISWTEFALRQAIYAELKSMKNKSNPINIAIQTELALKIELKNELSQVDTTIQKIKEFESQTYSQINDEEDSQMEEQRLEVLRAELSELRDVLKKIK